MKTTVEEIKSALLAALEAHEPSLRHRGTTANRTFEGTIPTMQGRQKVDGHYFASIVEKPKDVRLYFFPIYTHVDAFSISKELDKALKGKSCFHIKKLSPELESEIAEMIKLGIELYQKDGII